MLDEIVELLSRMHGRRSARITGKCLDVLVRAMLAQNTNLANSRAGYRQLRRAFPTWNAVMDAPLHQVQRQIAVCGLARMRARRLQALLRTIKQQHGKLDLDHLRDSDPATTYAYLTSFFGIGPRTAACTMLFGLGMSVFPVDNGVLRVARRLRLVRAKASHEETSERIANVIDPNKSLPLHVLMFDHAKDICPPKNPKCRECLLNGMCPYGRARVRHLRNEIDTLPSKQIREVILSRFVSAGIPKRDTDPDQSDRSTESSMSRD